ncbi:MAG TPA: toll/interleukin-1 receptor domain-containing protein, partial [Thermoanaerobaculia bacterium]|nr:toll/interleukin-1 receptor domain-containing protein [Thermoanaerobaculia bacterium]
MTTGRARHTGLRAAVDHLFGYDVFISYSRGDGAAFGRGLATELEEMDLSCFLDENELPAGYPLSGTLRAALRRSSVLALVSTKAARASTFVAMEVSTFAATKRPIVPIVIREAEGDIPEEQPEIPWESIRDRELVWVSDVADAVSASTVTAVRDALRVTRKRTLASRVMFSAAAVLLLVSLLAGGAAVIAIREQQRAEQEAKSARQAAARARAEEKRA